MLQLPLDLQLINWSIKKEKGSNWLTSYVLFNVHVSFSVWRDGDEFEWNKRKGDLLRYILSLPEAQIA